MSGANGSRSPSGGPDRRDGASPSAPAAVAVQGRARPNSWVYEVDPAARNGGPVAAEQIRRAWRTDGAGAIVPSEYVDNPYFRPAQNAPSRRRAPDRRALAVAGVLAVALAFGIVLVLTGGSRPAARPVTRAQPTSAHAPAARAASIPVGAAARTQVRRTQAVPALSSGPPVHARQHKRGPVRAAVPQMRLRASAPVWVCVQDGRGQVLVNGQTLGAGETLPALKGPAFDIFAGNGDFTITVNGVAHPGSGSPDPVAYVVRAGAVKQLAGYPAQPCA